MKINVEIGQKLTIEFDENSKEFQELFENYKKYFSDCCFQDFAEIIARNISKYGADEAIEGIGRVEVNGRKPWEIINGQTHHISTHVSVFGDVDINSRLNPEFVYTEIVNQQKQ